MEPFIIYAPWEFTKIYSHEGEEFIYVMEGSQEFIYGEEIYIMDAGDHVYVDATDWPTYFLNPTAT